MRTLSQGAAAVFFLAMGCSSKSPGAAAPPSGPSAFVGTWARSGTQALTCGSATQQTALGGTLVITLGTTSGTIVATESNGCTQTLTVSGNTATAAPGQVCMLTSSTGTIDVITVTSHTLIENGGVLTEGSMGTVMETNTAGKTEMCTLSTEGEFTMGTGDGGVAATNDAGAD